MLSVGICGYGAVHAVGMFQQIPESGFERGSLAEIGIMRKNCNMAPAFPDCLENCFICAAAADVDDKTLPQSGCMK